MLILDYIWKILLIVCLLMANIQIFKGLIEDLKEEKNDE